MGSDVGGFGKFRRTSSHCSKLKQEQDERNGYDDQVKEMAEANKNCVKRLQEEAMMKDSKINELQTQVEALNYKCQTSEESRKRLEKENADLVRQLQKAKENDSELLHVKEQAKAYKEDFESERRDRERAQSRLADVEMELEIVRRELRQYNLREMQDLHQRREASLEYHRQEYLRKNPQSVYQADHFEDRNPEDGEDEIDG